MSRSILGHASTPVYALRCEGDIIRRVEPYVGRCSCRRRADDRSGHCIRRRAPQKPFVDCSEEELVRAVPELAGIAFDANQNGLDGLLHTVGELLDIMLAKFVDVSAAEDIHEMRFEDGMVGLSRREAFRYAVTLSTNGAADQFVEMRIKSHHQGPFSGSRTYRVSDPGALH